MIFRSLTDRILFFFTALLLVVQLLAFSVVNHTNKKIAKAQFNREAAAAEKVFDGVIEQRNTRWLSLATSLAGMPGLVASVESQNGVQQAQLLSKYLVGSVANDDTVFASLHSLQGGVSQLVLAPGNGAKAVVGDAPLNQITHSIKRSPSFSTILVSGRLYKIVSVPFGSGSILTSTAKSQYWLTVGYEMGPGLATDIERLVLADVEFVVDWNKGFKKENIQSPLDQPAVLALPVAETDNSYALLMRLPLHAGAAAFTEQRITLMLLVAFSLFISLLAGYAIAHEITRPLKLLNRIAQKIMGGDYDQDIAIEQRDEVGQLADSIRHMSQSVADREEKILRLAYADTLTDLPNRAMFNDRLNQAVTVGKRSDTQFTVLMLDLDRFKYINDVLGHESGDCVLQEVARRLIHVLRESDTVARLGGDEFAILLHTGNADRVMTAVHKILDAMKEPVILNNQPVDIGCSIGIASYPEHGTEASLLMRRADIAMYAAKRLNSGYAYYDIECDEHQQEHLSLLGEIRRAVDADELQLFYQPKICLEDNDMLAVETLLRWQHPSRGLIPPDEFIPFAEHTGAIRLITAWVIEKAMVQSGLWHAQGQQIKMSINISARDLLDPNLPEMTHQALVKNGVTPSMVCFEITESALMEDPAKAHRTIQRLYDMGIEISIDDYGTGYSSLAYVKKLPVHELKIDREFVKNMIENPEDIAIVRSTIELGHNLGLKVVAEGIENQEELEILKEFGCDQVQGFLISHALSADDLEQWIAQSRHIQVNDVSIDGSKAGNE